MSYRSRNFTELLVEGIAYVVGGICAYDKNRFPGEGELYGQRAAAGSLSDATFSADKNPTKTFLVNNILERRL